MLLSDDNASVAYNVDKNVLDLQILGGELSSLIRILDKVWRLVDFFGITFNLLVDARSVCTLDESVMELIVFFEKVKKTSEVCVISTHIVLDTALLDLYDKLLQLYSPVRPMLLYDNIETVPVSFNNRRIR